MYQENSERFDSNGDDLIAVRNVRRRNNILTQSEMREAAKNRSPNYEQLSPEQQWMEDKELGILDWDGK